MRKTREYLVEVEGHGSFPHDMLRYDRGRFATPDDERVAGENSRGLRYVKVICYERPTEARWQSFLWHVVNVDELK